MNEQGNNTNNVSNSNNTDNSSVSVNNTQQQASPSIVNTEVVSQPASPSIENTGVVPQPVTPNVENTGVVQQPVTPNINTGVVPQPVTPNIENTGVVPQPVTPNVENTGVVPQPVTPNVDNTGVVQQPVTPSVEQLSEESNNKSQDNQASDDIKSSNYKPPGVFKSFILILFFGGLVAFIIFLPEIQAYVADYMSGNTGTPEITSGKLKCTLETNTTNFNKTFERVFVFTDKKLQSATFTSITKGDITEDEEALDKLNEDCKLKKDAVANIGGVTIACEYSNGLLTEREHFDYKEFDIETVKAAYAEAGADVIEYEYGYDIDKINS